MSLRRDIDEFLADKQIAFAGVSRDCRKHSRLVYRKLKEAGYRLYPINPNTQLIEDNRCYHDVKSLSEPVSNLLVIASPFNAVQIMEEAVDTPVKRIWVHSGPGKLAGMETEIDKIRYSGKIVISGWCPMMFLDPVKMPCSIHRFIARFFGNYPK